MAKWVMKPLYGFGGAAVFKVAAAYQDPNFGSLCSTCSAAAFREPWVRSQKFLPAVALGDKRIILVDGEGQGRDQSRCTSGDDIRSNMVPRWGGERKPS